MRFLAGIKELLDSGKRNDDEWEDAVNEKDEFWGNRSPATTLENLRGCKVADGLYPFCSSVHGFKLGRKL